MKDKWKSFLSIHRTGIRLLKVVKQIDRNILPLSILEACITAILPYVGLIFSARLIDALLAQSYQQAKVLTACMLITVFVLGIMNACISYHTKMSQQMLQLNLEILIRKKSMDLDYTTICNPEILQAIRNAEDASKYNGGLGYLVRIYKNLLQYLLCAVTAVVLAVRFCLTHAAMGGRVLSFFANPFVTLICLISAWIGGMMLAKNQAKQIKKAEDEIEAKHYIVENKLSYWLIHVLYNMYREKTIRVNGMKEVIGENIDKSEADMMPLFQLMGISSRKSILSEGLESAIFTVTAYVFVLIKAVTKAISVGSFTQYAGAFLQFHQASSKLVWSENEVSRITKNLVPLADYLDRSNQCMTGTIPIEKRNDNVYEIEFHDVGFCYPNCKEFSLRHVNAKLTLKNKLAVVGKNGAGKTTFIKLLCRLYDPTEGQITLNGIDIRKYDYQQYLSLFGVVFQNFYLFASSIGENVAVSNEYEQDKLQDCLAKAGVAEFVSTLEGKQDTVIENGDKDAVDLSGGQEQKISIARALYKDAPFVILDEPTAALDPISESEIYERFDEMVQDKTSIYISHRMSSCRFCDEILVFDQGAITERGSHESLLKKAGLYASLWNAQAQYYA